MHLRPLRAIILVCLVIFAPGPYLGTAFYGNGQSFMSLLRFILLASLTLLITACQTSDTGSGQKSPDQARVQGLLSLANDQWQLQDCHGQPLKLDESPLLDTARALLKDKDGQLLADFVAIKSTDGSYRPSQWLRLERQQQGCDEREARARILHAFGSQWDIQVNSKGLILQRPDQDPLALPYVQERMPGGGVDISSQANGLSLNLWVAYESCTDGQRWDIYGMRAQLRLNDQLLLGCAYPGPLQNL